MKLAKLQELANKGYAGGDNMGDYFDPKTGKPTDWHIGDSLEWFVALEIADTFDPDADDDDQIYSACHSLERGIEELQGAINSLNNKRG